MMKSNKHVDGTMRIEFRHEAQMYIFILRLRRVDAWWAVQFHK